MAWLLIRWMGLSPLHPLPASPYRSCSSSNIECNVAVGSIFAVYKSQEGPIKYVSGGVACLHSECVFV